MDCYSLRASLIATPQIVLLLVCDYGIINRLEQSTVTKVVSFSVYAHYRGSSEVYRKRGEIWIENTHRKHLGLSEL